MAAPPENGMATRQLAANTMSGSDALRVQPFPERNSSLGDTISNHGAVNVGPAWDSGKAAGGSVDLTAAGYSPMIFKTTRFGR